MTRRLFKVIIQTIYLDENDREILTQPVVVPREDWPHFVEVVMPQAVAAFCAEDSDDETSVKTKSV